MSDLPNAASVPRGLNVESLDKEIRRLGLVGAANDTKWNELINKVRSEERRPSYRSKWINGFISRWDVEWHYHLPFPFKGVMWLDISTLIGKRNELGYYLGIVEEIGFDFIASKDLVRVFGYLPRDMEGFGDE